VILQLLDPQSYFFNPYSMPPLLISVLVLSAGLFVVVYEHASRVSRYFLLYTLPYALYQFCMFLTHASASADIAHAWSQFGQVGAILIYPSIFHFAAVIGRDEEQVKPYIVLAWGSAFVFVIILLSTDQFLAGVHHNWWGYFALLGSIGKLFVFVLALFYFSTVYRLLSQARLAKSGSAHRRRTRGLAVAISIGAFGAVDFLPALGIEFFPWGFVPATLHWMIAVYITMRYRLLDITPEVAAQQIVDNMTDALIVLDAEKTVRLSNPAAERLFKIQEQQAVGKSLSEILEDKVAAGYIQAMLMDKPKNIFEFEYHLSGEGVITLSISVAIVSDSAHRPIAFVIMFRDVTERQQAHAELERRVAERTAELAVARDHALEASRTKSAFLANMSHELRTPLNAIIGYNELLQEDTESLDDQGLISNLTKISKTRNHLLNLVSMVRDLSKIEAGKMELHLDSFDIAPMVNDVAETFQALARKNNNALQVHCPRNIGSMVSDVTKVKQVLMNLLSNACKFTRDGSIDVTVLKKSVEGIDVIQVVVSDTGIGMSLDQQQNLFVEFSQADTETTRKYGGTGLGLAISLRFCQLLGGDIQVDSLPDEGSIFTMTLPVEMNSGRINFGDALSAD